MKHEHFEDRATRHAISQRSVFPICASPRFLRVLSAGHEHGDHQHGARDGADDRQGLRRDVASLARGSGDCRALDKYAVLVVHCSFGGKRTYAEYHCLQSVYNKIVFNFKSDTR